MNRSRKAFLHSLLALLLSISMLIGSTFAWFTDSVTTGSNVITTGTLGLEMYWTDDLQSGTWYNVEDPATNKVFNYDNWEPGYTEVRYLKLKNTGNLALNYQLLMTPVGAVGKLAEVIQVYYDANGNPVNDRGNLSGMAALGFLDRVMERAVTGNGTILPDGEVGLHPAGETVVTLAMQMITTAGNNYQDQSVGDGFTITALATQATYEEDSTGADYDANAKYLYPEGYDHASAPVTSQNGLVTAPVTLQGSTATATVPAGVKLEDGVEELSLTVRPKSSSDSGFTTVQGEQLIPIDVHVEGVAADNTTPIVIDLGPVMPVGLNMGNYTLIHVEDGVNKPMTLVSSKPALTVHNTFTYDPATGNVSVAMATFSEVAIVAETAAAWEGGRDYSWYDLAKPNSADYVIHNADQLAGLSAIVGGMDGRTQDSFAGKTVKLAGNINLGDGEDAPGNHIFYPIGYTNSTYKYEKQVGVEGVKSDFNSFEGTFDGQGHYIANFYQNTWDMFGDYNSGYAANSNHYDDGMGLFGYVVDGTVKNLTVKNFSSDGEFTPTGVIAAYAVGSTFENIAIVDCNPRVYNTGNGGIVGIGGETNDTNKNKDLTFKNISIDNTNVISALWGSYDVACGGLVGMFRGAGYVYMTNCHVAAQMDVYNDVCGNYQYYWYRYSGMLVGTNKNTLKKENGITYPETDKFVANNCTVHFGSWNDYYYCELVENSLASYTHDHQFSRLTQVQSVDVENMQYTTLTGDVKEIDNGRYNLVVVNGNHATENATCYHFKNGAVWNHEDAGYEDEKKIDEDKDGNIDLKEDKQHIHLPFNQLFTGYGWGAQHMPISNNGETEFPGVTILDGTTMEKFESKLGDDVLYRYNVGDTVPVGNLFREKYDGVTKHDVNGAGVYVSANKPLETISFPYDNVTSIIGGNSSGRNLLFKGAEYDYEGKDTGKAAGLVMNMPLGNSPATSYMQDGNSLYEVTPGKTYKFTAYLKPDAAMSEDVLTKVHWGLETRPTKNAYEGTPKTQVNLYTTTTNLSSDTWTKVEAIFTAADYTAVSYDTYNLAFMVSLDSLYQDYLGHYEDVWKEDKQIYEKTWVANVTAPGNASGVTDEHKPYLIYLDNMTVEELSSAGTFDPYPTDWANGTITFAEPGTVDVTIQDYQYCIPTTIQVEVTEGTINAPGGAQSLEHTPYTQDFEATDAEGNVNPEPPCDPNSETSIDQTTVVRVPDKEEGDYAAKLTTADSKETVFTNRVVYTDAAGDAVLLDVGAEYVFSAWVYFEEAFQSKVRLITSPDFETTGTDYRKVKGYDLNGTRNSTSGGTQNGSVLPAGQWIHVNYRFTAELHVAAPDKTFTQVYAAVGVAPMNAADEGKTVYIDDVTIYKAATVQSFEKSSTVISASSTSSNKVSFTSGEATAHTGAGSAGITVKSYQTSSATPNVYYTNSNGKHVPLELGKKYTLTAWVKSDIAFSPKLRVRAMYINSTAGTISESYYYFNSSNGNKMELTSPTLTTEWQQVTFTFTVPAKDGYDAMYIRVGVTSNDSVHSTNEAGTKDGYVNIKNEDGSWTVAVPNVYFDDVVVEPVN